MPFLYICTSAGNVCLHREEILQELNLKKSKWWERNMKERKCTPCKVTEEWINFRPKGGLKFSRDHSHP